MQTSTFFKQKNKWKEKRDKIGHRFIADTKIYLGTKLWLFALFSIFDIGVQLIIDGTLQPALGCSSDYILPLYSAITSMNYVDR